MSARDLPFRCQLCNRDLNDPAELLECRNEHVHSLATMSKSIEDAARQRGWHEEMNCTPWHFLVDLALVLELARTTGQPVVVIGEPEKP